MHSSAFYIIQKLPKTNNYCRDATKSKLYNALFLIDELLMIIIRYYIYKLQSPQSENQFQSTGNYKTCKLVQWL